MGSSTIGDSNFPIAIALVGWFGFSFDSFDSTCPDSPLVSHTTIHVCLGDTKVTMIVNLVVRTAKTRSIPSWTVAPAVFVLVPFILTEADKAKL